MESLLEFRKRKDEFLKTGTESPIPVEERTSFAGLKYFPDDQKLRFLVPLARVPEEELEFETSSGDKKIFKRIGKLGFSVEGQAVQITLYQAASGSYFLPFRDATSGKETYGAGRDLEVEEKEGKFVLDFNFAYNPYCAYSPTFSGLCRPWRTGSRLPLRRGRRTTTDGKNYLN